MGHYELPSKFTAEVRAWANTELTQMIKHVLATGVSTKTGSPSIERWIVVSLGKYLSEKLCLHPEDIAYERPYDANSEGKKNRSRCDLFIDETWIEIKHIWKETQPKQKHSLNGDIHRVTGATIKKGQLIVFEIGEPEWYLKWKKDSEKPRQNTIFIKINI